MLSNNSFKQFRLNTKFGNAAIVLDQTSASIFVDWNTKNKNGQANKNQLN